MDILQKIAIIRDLYPVAMVLIPDLCLMADTSVYLQNIYSGKVTTLSCKQASDLHYYYRKSKTPSDENEYIYDYTYDRVESILRLLVGKYKRNKILNLKQIHEYELSYEFYEQYYPRIITFDNIDKELIMSLSKSRSLPYEFWIDICNRLRERDYNQYKTTMYYLFINNIHVSKILNNYISNNVFILENTEIARAILTNPNTDKYILRTAIDLLEAISEISVLPELRSIACAISEKICRYNVSDIQFYAENKSRIIAATHINESRYYIWMAATENVNINECLYFIDHAPRIYARNNEFVKRNILCRNHEWINADLLDIINRYNIDISCIFKNRKLTRSNIMYIISNKSQESFTDGSFNGGSYDLITHPSIYLEDLKLFGINIYETADPEWILNNPNNLIPNKEIFDKMVFTTCKKRCEQFTFLKHIKINKDDMNYFLDLYIKYNNNGSSRCVTANKHFTHISNNPNLDNYILERIINIIAIDTCFTLRDIDWIAVFNNPNISIKYIEKIFRKHPNLFA
jgi:hypothetical protein